MKPVGRNEAIFVAYSREGNVWVSPRVREPRNNMQWPGIMLSAFQDEVRSIGFEVPDGIDRPAIEYRCSRYSIEAANIP